MNSDDSLRQTEAPSKSNGVKCDASAIWLCKTSSPVCSPMCLSGLWTRRL